MSKKLIRNYLLVLIITFIVFITGIVLIIDSTTLQLSKNNALNYLSIVENRYEENNYDATQTIADFSAQANFLREWISWDEVEKAIKVYQGKEELGI